MRLFQPVRARVCLPWRSAWGQVSLNESAWGQVSLCNKHLSVSRGCFLEDTCAGAARVMIGRGGRLWACGFPRLGFSPCAPFSEAPPFHAEHGRGQNPSRLRARARPSARLRRGATARLLFRSFERRPAGARRRPPRCRPFLRRASALCRTSAPFAPRGGGRVGRAGSGCGRSSPRTLPALRGPGFTRTLRRTGGEHGERALQAKPAPRVRRSCALQRQRGQPSRIKIAGDE